LPRDHSSNTPRLRYNFDVLDCILHHLPIHDLPSAALVGNEWALATRRPLYARITFDTDLRSAPLLARTLRSSPHLRPLVRHLSLLINLEADDTTPFDWLQSMPDGSVHELYVGQISFDIDFTTFILQSPIAQSVRCLKGRGDFIQTNEHLRRCLALPRLERLSLYVPYKLDILAPISLPPRLTRVSLMAHSYTPFIVRFLALVGSHLEQFDLDTALDALENHHIPPFLTALERHARQLRRLTIQSKSGPAVPYLDCVSRLLPSLEYLHVGLNTFSSALFADIPRRLRHLRLEHYYTLPFPFTKAEEIIMRAGRAESSLQSLAIFVRGGEFDDTPFARLGVICRECGIDFNFTKYEGSMYWWDDGEFMCRA